MASGFAPPHRSLPFVLERDDTRIVLAPADGGRVLTTLLAGGEPVAWLADEKDLRRLPPDAPFRNVGGQDRLWIGPEGGPHGFFFEPGAPCEGSRWRVPRPLDRLALRVVARAPDRASMEGSLVLRNRAGSRFSLGVSRCARALSRSEVRRALGPLPPGARAAGSETTSELRNAGDAAFDPRGGLPQLWILGQFPVGPRVEVLAPLRPGFGRGAVEDRYFGRPGTPRLRVARGLARMRADGTVVSKFGIAAEATPGVAAALDPDRGLLVLARFGVARARYANFLWDPPEGAPWNGDAFQSYSSGDGSFFELESVSPARALRPGARLRHRHATFVVRGAPRDLARLARRAFAAALAR